MLEVLGDRMDAKSMCFSTSNSCKMIGLKYISPSYLPGLIPPADVDALQNIFDLTFHSMALRFSLSRCARSIRPRTTQARTLSTPATVSEDTAAKDVSGDVSELTGKKTREHLLSAFSARAMACVKYDYFAQRAELECELDAASTFRSLTDASKQQAMGILELLEDYGDADYGNTLDNVEAAAARERELADNTYPAFAATAAEDHLDHVDTWFQDLADAAARASDRLEMTSAILDSESFIENDDEVVDEPVPEGK